MKVNYHSNFSSSNPVVICYHDPMGERKISNTNAGIMVTVAFVLDCINIVVDFATIGMGGFFMDAIISIIFMIWFSHFGVSLGSSRNAGRTILAILLDAFPVTDLMFPWTLQVAYTAFTERHATPAGESIKKLSRIRSGWRI